MLRVEMLAHTPDAERLVAAAAKLCYSKSGIDDLMDNLTPEKTSAFLEMLSGLGHDSPLEHASFTFGAEGVSRSLLAQLTRHRIASYSVQSQRYVDKSSFGYIIPPEIEGSPEAAEIFKEAMEDDARRYEQLKAILFEARFAALLAENNITLAGSDGTASGTAETVSVANSERVKELRRAAEKAAMEDARYVLPNACDTKIIFTMNARSLQNFFRLRCCNRAQWEIRALADEMLRLVKAAAPLLFAAAGPSCVLGSCSEGAYNCGKILEVRKKYRTADRK